MLRMLHFFFFFFFFLGCVRDTSSPFNGQWTWFLFRQTSHVRQCGCPMPVSASLYRQCKPPPLLHLLFHLFQQKTVPKLIQNNVFGTLCVCAYLQCLCILFVFRNFVSTFIPYSTVSTKVNILCPAYQIIRILLSHGSIFMLNIITDRPDFPLRLSVWNESSKNLQLFSILFCN